MKYKRKVAILSLSVLCASLVSVSSLIALSTEGNKQNEKEEDNSTLNIQEKENIQILSSTRSTDGNTISVQYTLKPSTINYVNFNTSLMWSSRTSDEFESETWHNDKNTEDYVTFDVDQSTKTINFHCQQAFGHEMVFTLSSPKNSAIRSSMTLNYTRRELSSATATIADDGFIENKALSIDCVLPVYSVGSVGEKPTDKFTLEKNYYESSGRKFEDLFSTPSTEGLYATRYKFKGSEYTNPDTLKAAIKQNVSEYMLSLLDLKNPVTFTSKDLEEAFTYEYAAYSMGGKIVYLKNSSLMTSFLTKYEEYYAKGNAFQVTVKYDTKTVLTKKLSITLSADSLTGIEIGDGGITF